MFYGFSVVYNASNEVNPQNAPAHHNKGVALYNLGKNEDAIVEYDKAIEINPHDIRI